MTAFVTRQNETGTELLVFKHPDAGVQLPAGTVELGEAPEDAVIREVREETGLNAVNKPVLLDRWQVLLPEGEMAVLRMSKLFDEPAYDSSSGGYGLDRGSLVKVLAHSGGYSQVSTDPLRHYGGSSVRVSDVRGYVRTSMLTNNIDRYFYHLTSMDDNNGPWETAADGLEFKCFWTSLELEIGLNERQRSWLLTFLDRLI